MENQSPEIVGIVINGTIFHFAIGFSGKPQKIYGGVDINETSRRKYLSFDECDSQETADTSNLSSNEPSRSNIARFEISLTQIAQNLILD